MPPNLELVINGEQWQVQLLHINEDKKYYMVNLNKKILYIHGTNIDQTKYAVWQNHHEPYKENYYG
jgi:hypothetical protein